MVLLSTALEALGVRPQPLGTTAPSSPATGQTWVDSSGPSPVLKVWTGSAWVSTAGGGGGSTTAIGTTAPSSPTTGQIWLDTTTTPPALNIWTGTEWAAPSAPAMPFYFPNGMRFNLGTNDSRADGYIDFDGNDIPNSSIIFLPLVPALAWDYLATLRSPLYLRDRHNQWVQLSVKNSQVLGNFPDQFTQLLIEPETYVADFNSSGPVWLTF